MSRRSIYYVVVSRFGGVHVPRVCIFYILSVIENITGMSQLREKENLSPCTCLDRS